MKEVKPADPAGSDVSDGIAREWFKVGRKYFGITDDGVLIDVEGFIMSGIDDAGNVVGFVHDKDAYRVAEAIRRHRWIDAKMWGPFRALLAERASLH
jgi:hypothetical protein